MDDTNWPTGLAKTILQVTVPGGWRKGRQKKKWEEVIKERTGLELSDNGWPRKERSGGGLSPNLHKRPGELQHQLDQSVSQSVDRTSIGVHVRKDFNSNIMCCDGYIRTLLNNILSMSQ